MLDNVERKVLACYEVECHGFLERFEKSLEKRQKETEPLVEGINESERIGDLYMCRLSIVDLRGDYS